jgi:REP element-mobilizing transposase RayT
MARPLRIQYPNAFYHVMSRGNEGKRIFRTRQDYERMKFYFREARDRYGFVFYAYALMGNHFHILGETPGANLSAVMHFLNGSYTTYFNTRTDRLGHLFQGRYRSILVEKDAFLMELTRYIHLNPVRAGLVKRPEDYEFSSYRACVDPACEDVVSREFLWRLVSDRIEEAPGRYRRFVESAIGREDDDPFRNVFRGAVLGSDAFIRETMRKVDEEGGSEKGAPRGRKVLRGLDLEGISEAVGALRDAAGEAPVKKNFDRDLAIYAARKHTACRSREIGDFFGGLSESGVTRVCRRFENKMEKDGRMREEYEKLKESLSDVEK